MSLQSQLLFYLIFLIPVVVYPVVWKKSKERRLVKFTIGTAITIFLVWITAILLVTSLSGHIGPGD